MTQPRLREATAADGRRGWINRLATHPDHRGRGLARHLLSQVESRLRARGCRKVNLLIEPTNRDLVAFYRQLGYTVDDSSSWRSSCDAVQRHRAAAHPLR